MKNFLSGSKRRQSGFSLVELIITVGIIAVVASISWSAYESQQIKNRRTEAISDLSQLQVFMARCYADNGGYECCDDATLAGYRADNPPPIPPNRQYVLAFNTTNVDGALPNCKQAQGFTITATPVPGSQVDDDTFCRSFTIDHTGLREARDNTAALNPACWTD